MQKFYCVLSLFTVFLLSLVNGVAANNTKNITVKGKIRCQDPVGRDLGYLSRNQNEFLEYYNLSKNASAALSVCLTYTKVAGKTTYTQLSLKANNGPKNYCYVAGSVTASGVTNGIGAGVYSTGTFCANKDTTPKGSKPVKGKTNLPGLQPKVETAIWKYNPSTKALSAGWVNPDGSKPQTFLVWYSESHFGFTGDIDKLSANYDVRRLTCKLA